MAVKSDKYDSPNYTINREHCAGEIGGGATTVYAKFHNYMGFKLKTVHFRVTTAGTTTGAGFDVYQGTTSIATIALSTNTAGYTTSLAVGSDYTSLQALELKSLADATIKAVVSYEFANTPGANMTQ